LCGVERVFSGCFALFRARENEESTFKNNISKNKSKKNPGKILGNIEGKKIKNIDENCIV